MDNDEVSAARRISIDLASEAYSIQARTLAFHSSPKLEPDKPTRIKKHAQKKQNPKRPRSLGVPPPFLAETEGFEPSIQVLAQMLP
jgi:hypothetical protein